jgi:tetratricopeptide (TPR) repeat protein
MNAYRSLALVVAALVGTAGAASAQGKCDINTGKPFQLTSARIYLNKAAAPSGKADEKPKHLANGVKVLTENGEKIDNQLGRNWLLAKLLYQWTRQERQPLVTTRGQLGYTENPSGQIDILAAMDTALTEVETAAPQCADSTRIYRRSLFAQVYRQGIDALNADQLDSATTFLNRALVIQKNSPLVFNALALIAQKREDTPGMIQNFTRVIEYSGSDTSFAGIKKTAMVNVGVLRVNQAEAAQGEERTKLLREAETSFRTFLTQDPNNTTAQQGLARVLGALGDTAAIAKIYAEMLANPDKYQDIQLFEAGSGAVRAKQPRLGIQLLEAGLKKNPYFRDGLYNLATAYFDSDDAENLGRVVKRLVELDPNNADNWRLYAGQFQIRQQTAQATKKPAPKWVTDSLLLYIQKFQSINPQVNFTSFDHTGAQHELQGSVMNTSSAEIDKTLTFEFLNAEGAVVATKTAPVKVPANSSADFTVQVTQSGIVGFRYKPL